MILVDTSVWISFFSTKKSKEQEHFAELMEQQKIASCLPIKTELLSGNINESTQRIIHLVFKGLPMLDLNWSKESTWDSLAEIAQMAYQKKHHPPGIVDRMIILCAQENKTLVWTLDKKLLALLNMIKLSYSPESP
ncbi:PIN domain-containing protein [bacterium]|nr:PIN domain-containing protein [bacterium]